MKETIKLSSQSVYTIFNSQQYWMRAPVAPHPHQHLVSVFWIFTIPVSFWLCLAVLICKSLMTYDVEHLFICLFVSVYPLVRCLFKSFAHFLSCSSPYCWVLSVLYMFWITIVIVLNSPNGYYTELDSTAFNRLPW